MKMKFILKIYVLFGTILMPALVNAQCAMCRTQVVNNVSHGEVSFAAGLNFGILYLFFTPYVALGVVAYFWFKNAKANERKRSLASRIGG